MPLVSGVCRAASAPMLSHGGSRLNASKPEANPKTSCPHRKKSFGFSTDATWFCLLTLVRTAHQTALDPLCSPPADEQCSLEKRFLHFKSNRLSTDRSIPLPRWREVHEKFTRFFFSIMTHIAAPSTFLQWKKRLARAA